MKKARRWLLITASLLMLVTDIAAVAPFKKVSIATTTASTTSKTSTTTSSTNEAPSSEATSDTSPSGPTKNSKLTGIPQIDYIWDPNLPRELHGYNLSSYPFFSTVPPDEDIHFKCDGLHDGFYASIEHKCQVYHHCVYGIRHDFLCANFTAFDQRTFICHFVSDVDCEGSKNYWNRNDDLYMATTPKTTTTSSTEAPPPTPRRRLVRPLRPLRRPSNRRPVDDYYYDEEEEQASAYEDDYYEERLNRRRKPRPRQRKPVSDYEDDYSDDKPRRHNTRDRFRDEEELEEDYDTDRRKQDRPRNKALDRRKIGGRKSTTAAGRLGGDERRSFGDDRAQPGRKDKSRITPSADPVDAEDPPPRRLTGRRRINEKRKLPASNDDLDDFEKRPANAPDQEEAAEEEAPPKVKTTPKPLEEFITPKASSSSVYARPRAPPRIARPVPLNEKKKFQYPVQKTGATPSPAAAHANDDDYYEDEAYDDVRPQRVPPRRRVVDSKLDEEVEAPSSKRRNQNDTPLIKKPSRTTIRRPTTEKKRVTTADEEYYDSAAGASDEPVDSHTSSRKRPFSTRNRSSFGPAVGRGAEDVDFVDDDYEERPLRPAHRLRPKAAARKATKKPRRPIEEEDAYEEEPEPQQRNRVSVNRARAGSNSRLRQSTTSTTTTVAPIEDVESDVELEEEEEEDEPTAPATLSRGAALSSSGRTATVRVVKRPFLPSRGGSPYLPRGLQPVGVALKPLSSHTTDSSPLDMGSTISGVRLLEHGAPILRDSGSASGSTQINSHLHDTNGYERERERERDRELHVTQTQRTTLPPRSALPASQSRPEPQPKITLDELYETDYDVTLNDALNPTLKPLSQHHSNHPNHNGAFENAYASETGVGTFVNNNKSPTTLYHNNNNNQYQQQPQQQQQFPQFPPFTSNSAGTTQTHQLSFDELTNNIVPPEHDKHLNIQLPALTAGLIPAPTTTTFTAQRRMDVVDAAESEASSIFHDPGSSVYDGVSSYDVPLSSIGRLPNDITHLLRRLRKVK
uniref:Chitin-binding type-2 domain-containing protein n=1 Tax=Zeugodacus cucurbitae TaxID=28588 RepID=A0A0A1X8R4_ZEUCU